MTKQQPLTPTERMSTSEEFVASQRAYVHARLVELTTATGARADELVRELKSLGQLIGIAPKHRN
jgi:hypothetical protein